MKKKKFKPEDWLPGNNKFDSLNEERRESPLEGGQRGVLSANDSQNSEIIADLENIISQIESQNLDITPTYANWRDIGFAFAETLGEEGRSFFHRISTFYPDYSKSECDKQFDKCLKSGGSGVTMKSFFHFAKTAGIDISPSNPKIPQKEKLPNIPENVYDHLPDFLKKVVMAVSTPHEKDLLLLGSLVTSVCAKNLF